MKNQQTKIIFSLVLLCFIFIITFSNVSAGISYINCYSSGSRFFSPGETYKPRISIYCTNQDYVTFEAYRLKDFKLKNGKFYYTGKNPEESGDRIYKKTIRFFRGKTLLRKKYKSECLDFNSRKSGRYTYINGRFRPPISKTGVYLVRITGKKDKWERIFVASPISMIIKHSPDFVEGFLYDVKTNMPAPNVEVKLYDERGFRYLGKTNDLGWFHFKTGKDLKGLITVLAHRKDAYAIYSFSASQNKNEPSVYLYTDRPVYRPGQKAFFKGIVTKLKNKNHILLKDKPLKLTIKDARYNTLKTLDFRTTDNGSYNGEFHIPSDVSLGRFTIISEIDNHKTYNHFQVQEYRKPKFEVFVKPLENKVLQGEYAKVEVRARYYFGNPVKGGTVHWEVKGVLDPLKVPGIYSYHNYGYSSGIKSGTAKLDENGKCEFTFKTLKHAGNNYRYIISCSVKDEANETIEGYSSIKVPASSKSVAVAVTPRYAGKGKKLKAHIYTVDMDGKPVSAKVSLTFSTRTWNSKEKIYENITFKTAEITTNKDGVGLLEISPEKSGRIVVLAKVFDDEKRLSLAKDSAWVSGYSYTPYKYPRLEIIKDKRNYKSGDTANVLINSNYKGMYMFVTLEQDKIYKRWIFPANNNSTSLNIPIKQEYSPGVYLKVSFISNGRYVSGQKFIPVAEENRYINVEIDTDKEIYSPGETAVYEIKTRDDKGSPVPAEVSIGVVDDSIYAIEPDTTPNIRTYYYGRRRNLIRTNYSIPREYPGGSYQKVPEKRPVVPEQRVRKNFKDTTYWNPRVFTGEEGSAKIPVQLADNLTRWRSTVRAFTKNMQVGSAKQKITARKEMTIRLAVPRFFRYKDRIEVSSLVSNDSRQPQEINVSFHCEGAKITGGKDKKMPAEHRRSREILLKPGEERKLDYTLDIKPYSLDGKVKITAKASSKSGLFDGVEREFPVEPFGRYYGKYLVKSIKESFSDTVDLPADTIKETAKLTLRLSPSIASNIMGSLGYMAKYPYGCTEQTMSRFLPLCILKCTLRDLEIENAEIENKIPKMIKKGFRKIYDYQHHDGGWGWWKTDRNEPFLSAFVIYGFHQAQKAGYKVNPRVLSRGLNSLKKQYLVTKSPDTKAFMLYSLNVSGKADRQMAESLLEDVNKMNSYAKAMFAISCYDLNLKDKAREILENLEKEGEFDGNFASWKSGSKGYGWMRSDIETTAWILIAYLKIKPQSKNIGKTVNWLISQKRGDHWVSTKTTGYVIMALSEYLKKSGELEADFTVKIKLNGKIIDELKFDKKSLFKKEKEIIIPCVGVVSRPRPSSVSGFDSPVGVRSSSRTAPLLHTGKNTIEIQKNGKGILYLSRSLEFYTDEEPESETQNFQVKKRLYVLDAERKWKLLDRKIRVGEEVMVELWINPEKSYSYVMIEDPLPSGFEVQNIRMLRHYHYSNSETRDNRVVFFRTYLMKSKRGTFFSYITRAERQGILNVMPVKVELMYNPRVKGMGGALKLEVVNDPRPGN